MSPKHLEKEIPICLWVDYKVPSLNKILAAPMRARFAGKRDAKLAWLEALLNNQDSALRLRAIAEDFSTETTFRGAQNC